MTPQGSSGLCVDPSGESLGHWDVSWHCLQAWTKDELVSIMFFCGSAGTSVVLWLLSSWTPPSGDPLLTQGAAEGSQ